MFITRCGCSCFFFFKQKTAYELRISDWSSDVCSSDLQLCMTYIHRGLIPDGGGMYFLPRRVGLARAKELNFSGRRVADAEALENGSASRRARVCKYGWILVVDGSWNKQMHKHTYIVTS